MNHVDKDGKGDSGFDGRLRRNLVALGSAAVLTVYAAGYVRTKPATERFANETANRRRMGIAEAHAAMATAAAIVEHPVAPASAKPPAASKAKKAGVTKAPQTATTTKVAAAPSQPPALVLSEPAPPATPASAPTTNAPDSAQSADTTKEKAPPKWKDGTYTAWGYSRHGDLEAAVEIKGGRITAAYITQCWTRYSCNVIAALIPQVAQRQSENVDTVSGATQSADAFYYAVMQALIKAK